MNAVISKTFSVLWRTAVLLLVAVALYHLCWIPYGCNREVKAVQRSTDAALSAPPMEAPSVARRNLLRLDRCLPQSPTDVRLLMLAAANYQILDRHADAIAAYERALRIDKRPEIYYELGLTQLSVGDRSSALASLTRAARFAQQYMYETGDPSMIDDIRRNMGLAPLKR